MRKIPLLLLALLFTCLAYSQKTEIKVNAYSGSFFFRGSGSTSVSTIYVGDDLGYYNPMPYGRKSGISYALELQTQRVTKQSHLFGVGIGYERLLSKAGIHSAGYTFAGTVPATGNFTLENTFITVNPYIGKRLVNKAITLDIIAGIDLAFSTKVFEQAKITSEHNTTYTLNRKNHPFDLRPRVQVSASYKRVGLVTGYSLGTTNLYSYDNPNYITAKAYSNFLRLGVSFRLK